MVGCNDCCEKKYLLADGSVVKKEEIQVRELAGLEAPRRASPPNKTHVDRAAAAPFSFKDTEGDEGGCPYRRMCRPM